MTYSILFIGLILVLGHLFSSLFEKTRLPDVLPLMVLGMLLGPVFKLVNADAFGQAGHVFTQLALILVLFRSGLNFRFSSLRGGVWEQGFVLATAAFVLISLVIGYLVKVFLGIPQLYGLIMGVIIADNSVAIILPMLSKLKISSKARAILFLETNFVGVYTVIIVLALLSVAVKGEKLSAMAMGLDVFRSFIIAIGFSVVAGLFWMRFLDKVRRMENAISLTFAFVLLVYSITTILGGEGVIAVLVFGIVAGNIRLLSRLWFKKWDFQLISFSGEEKDFFGEFEFIFKTLFFVFMGISMQLGRLDLLLIGFALALIKFLVRAVVVNWSVSKSVSKSDCAVLLAMCPVGLVSAVLAALAAQELPQADSAFQDVVYSVIFFSIILSNFMSFRIEKGKLQWVNRSFFARHADGGPIEEAVKKQEEQAALAVEAEARKTAAEPGQPSTDENP